jgi:dihydrofolate reductase
MANRKDRIEMRRLIVSEMVTLDGYFAGPNGEIDWFFWNEEMANYSADLLSRVDTILFGRVTYELMADYWPSASMTAEEPIIIDKMNNLPKIVFSKTLEKAEWENTKLVEEINKDDILKMKQQPGKDIVIYGSGSIVSALTQLGLIDEYRILVNPIILGSGKLLFKNLTERVNLKLVQTKTFKSSVILLHYSVIRNGEQ